MRSEPAAIRVRMTELDIEKTGKSARILEEELRKRVIGQDAAVQCVSDALLLHRQEMLPQGRPIASVLFLGPTGTGKTHVVESLAEVMFGTTAAVLKVDCAEFQHSHEIAKLVGSPPGYLGHKETHPVFTQEALDQWRTSSATFSIVLFDEIEKASDSLWKLMLGILDRAVLTLGDNRKVDFSRCLIFLTSNLGAREMEKLRMGAVGFAESAQMPIRLEKMEGAATAAARRHFSPEFMNRITHTVTFNPLTRDEMRLVLEKEIVKVGEQARCSRLAVSDDFKEFLMTEGFDPRWGARYLTRTLTTYLLLPLARLAETRQLKENAAVVVDYVDGKARFHQIEMGVGAE